MLQARKRNSYSKTDTDAVFMRMKDKTLKAAYNVPAVYEVSRPVSHLPPVTPYCSNYIPHKELVNPQLLLVAPCYPLLL
jgi:hypothetical protein